MQGFHQLYGHIRRVYTVLAKLTYMTPIFIYAQLHHPHTCVCVRRGQKIESPTPTPFGDVRHLCQRQAEIARKDKDGREVKKVQRHQYTEALYIGLARTIFIRCIYGNFGREITKYTVIYGVYIRFWPTLAIHHHAYSPFLFLFNIRAAAAVLWLLLPPNRHPSIGYDPLSFLV